MEVFRMAEWIYDENKPENGMLTYWVDGCEGLVAVQFRDGEVRMVVDGESFPLSQEEAHQIRELLYEAIEMMSFGGEG